MNIYLITMDEVDYDEYRGFVVAANTEQEVKDLCRISKEKNETKFPDNLYESNIESITIVGTTDKYDKPEIILSDYHAG